MAGPDTTAPTVQSITSVSDGAVALGETAIIKLNFSEALKINGKPILNLGNGVGTAVYSAEKSDLAHGIVAFTYKATAGDASYPELQALNVDLNGGSISDRAGNAADLSNAHGGVGFYVDTQKPVGELQYQQHEFVIGIGSLAINAAPLMEEEIGIGLHIPNDLIIKFDNGRSIHSDGGSFQYVVQEGEKSVDHLTIVSVKSASGDTMHDAAGNVIDFMDVFETTFDFSNTRAGHLDGIRPEVDKITVATTGNSKALHSGDQVTFTVKMSENVDVRDGLALTLNNGDKAMLVGGDALDTKTLTFIYTVGSDTVKNLKVVGVDQSDGDLRDISRNAFDDKVNFNTHISLNKGHDTRADGYGHGADDGGHGRVDFDYHIAGHAYFLA